MGKGYGVRPQDGTTTKWECYDMDTGKAVASDISNQEAWREVDRRMMEAKSRQEDVSDWVWKHVCNEGRDT